MKHKKVLISLVAIILLLFITTFITKTYLIVITDRISQHPHHFPKTKGSYDVLLYGFFPFILEMSEPINCTKIAVVTGKIEKVRMGDGTGTLKQNYSGYHMFGDKVICIK